MRYTCIAIAALLFSTPAIAEEAVYDLGTLKLASRQAFLMANSARVWAEASDDAACRKMAHSAMTRAADAALFAIKASDTLDPDDARRAIKHGMLNAERSVRQSSICLQSNYKLPVQVVIPYELPDLEVQARP